MSMLQIETLKFVHSSCCFTIPELVLSDQLDPDTDIFRTNFFGRQTFGPTYDRTILSLEKSRNYRFYSGTEFNVSL